MLRYQDVFVPGGFPRHTYNPRIEMQLEQKLSESKDNLCKLVTVTGQTKAGKTVLTRKVLPPEDTIWIEGGSLSEEEDFWQTIVEQLSLFQAVGTESSEETSGKIGGKGTADANFFVAKGSGEINAELGKTRSETTTNARSVSSRIVALKALQSSLIPVVIDDFHYVAKEMQGSIARALKPLIFNGLPVIVIAIPHRRYDALKVEKEMTGRILPIEIPTWSESELCFISDTGFELLNYKVPKEVSTRLASESIGSPHLMQDFCRGICKLLQLGQAKERTELVINSQQIESVFRDVAETIGRPIFEKLARGPRQRTDRVQRELEDGRIVDIYELVLHDSCTHPSWYCKS